VDGTYDLLVSLLSWADLQTTSAFFQQNSLDAQELVESVKSQLETQAQAKRIRVVLEAEAGHVFKAYSNANGLAFVIRNVLSNAIKYSYPDSQVVITLQVLDQYVQVAVKDEGVGISASQISKLYVPDQSKRRPGTAGETSTGLGLIFVKEIADQLGIRLHVSSVPDEGTEFLIMISKKGLAKTGKSAN